MICPHARSVASAPANPHDYEQRCTQPTDQGERDRKPWPEAPTCVGHGRPDNADTYNHALEDAERGNDQRGKPRCGAPSPSIGATSTAAFGGQETKFSRPMPSTPNIHQFFARPY